MRIRLWLSGILTAAVLLSALAGASRAASKRPLILAKKGIAEAVILIPAKPTGVEKFAANELKYHLDKMCGGQFEITSAAGVNQPVISIGRTSLAKGFQMGGEPWKRKNREAFRVLRKGNALMICGNSESDGCDQGTLWGVYGFLKKLGVGYYLWNSLGEVVPSKSDISIEEIDFTDAPTMEMRGATGSATTMLANLPKDSNYLYDLRNMCGGRDVEFEHMHYKVLTPEILKEHPEYGKDTGQNICLTNPGVRELFVEYSRKTLAADPNLYATSLFPDDGTAGPSCSCPSCQALLKLGRSPHLGGGYATSHSDLLVDFYNSVARGIRQDFPNRYVIGAAYSTYLDPPEKTRVEPNVIMMVAPLVDLDEVNPGLNDLVQGWRDMGVRKMYWYGYDMGNEPIPHDIARRFANYRRWKLDGMYIERRQTVAFSGLNYWIEDQLFWNWNQDVDDLINQFCTGLFGAEIGPIMRDFFLAWEKRDYDTASRYLADAQSRVTDPQGLCAKRITLFGRGFELCKCRRDFAVAAYNNDAQALLTSAKGVGEAHTVLRNEYTWAYAETDVSFGSPGRLRMAVPYIEQALNFKAPGLDVASKGIGPMLCLTNNAGEPSDRRIDAVAKVTHNPQLYDPMDNPEHSKLFDGRCGKAGDRVGICVTFRPDGIWEVTIDLKGEFEINRVDIERRPFYVDIQVSRDGKDYQSVDKILSPNPSGYVRSREFSAVARSVKLVMYSLQTYTKLDEVEVWGRRIASEIAR